jgi:hypothetical protein
MNKIVSYRGYQITPFTEKDDSGKWRVVVRIARFTAGGPFVKSGIRSDIFTHEESFETEEKAREEGIAFGKKILDGDIPGLSVTG